LVDWIPEYYSQATLVLGCGNVLLGDDGFGPEVITYLGSSHGFSDNVALLDAGTAVGEILLDMALSPVKPQRLILVDAMENEQPPGTVSFSKLEKVAKQPWRTTSSHQAPTSILLAELQDLGGVEVLLLTVQPGEIPEEIRPGLSPAVRLAVGHAAKLILEFLSENKDMAPGRTSLVAGAGPSSNQGQNDYYLPSDSGSS
jgi:coenzyme F420 hydrogenase subunit delta